MDTLPTIQQLNNDKGSVFINKQDVILHIHGQDRTLSPPAATKKPLFTDLTRSYYGRPIHCTGGGPPSTTPDQDTKPEHTPVPSTSRPVRERPLPPLIHSVMETDQSPHGDRDMPLSGADQISPPPCDRASNGQTNPRLLRRGGKNWSRCHQEADPHPGAPREPKRNRACGSRKRPPLRSFSHDQCWDMFWQSHTTRGPALSTKW